VNPPPDRPFAAMAAQASDNAGQDVQRAQVARSRFSETARALVGSRPRRTDALRAGVKSMTVLPSGLGLRYS
jgi:hypothetical protein